MVNRDRALQALQEEVDELRRRVGLLEQGGVPAAAPLPAMEPSAAAAAKPAAAESAAAAADKPVDKPAPVTVAESDCGDFVAARNGKSAKTYHRRDCYYAPKLLTAAGAFYPTRAAAEADGRKPCRRCAEPALPVGYVATGKGSKTYHQRSCRYAATILNSGRPYRAFANQKEAESSGYRVCERCVDRPGSLLDTGNGA